MIIAGVEELLERYRSATDDSKRPILDEITRELIKHMEAEESVLYPILRTSLPDGKNIMEHAVRERDRAKDVLLSIFDMDSKIATLRKAIALHVRGEEGDIFPQMEKLLEEALLDELGLQIEEAKRIVSEHPPSSAAKPSSDASVGGVLLAPSDRLKTSLLPLKRRRAPPASVLTRCSQGLSLHTRPDPSPPVRPA